MPDIYSYWWKPFPNSTGWLIPGDYNLYVDYKTIHSGDNKKIFVQVEPPEIGNCREWVVSNQGKFNLIIGWDDWLRQRIPQMKLLPMGVEGWLYEDQYLNSYEKRFEVSFLLAEKRDTFGHELKHQLWRRLSEIINIPVKSYIDTRDEDGNLNRPMRFERLYKHCQFSIWFENSRHNNFFTERIVDSFLSKTIPIYWGCLNLGEYYDMNGVYTVNNPDDVVRVCNSLTPDTYNEKLEYVNRNYEIAKEFQEGHVWFTKLNNYIGEIL